MTRPTPLQQKKLIDKLKERLLDDERKPNLKHIMDMGVWNE
jgi:hypothetical protein